MEGALRRVLICDRGVLATELVVTWRRRGLETVQLFSADDAEADWVDEADYAVHDGSQPGEVAEVAAPAETKQSEPTPPVDWNDAPKPRVKKPKGRTKAPGAAQPRREEPGKPKAVIAKPWKARTSKPAAGSAEAESAGRGPKPPVGKASSKKNRARQLAKANSGAPQTRKPRATKPGKPRSQS